MYGAWPKPSPGASGGMACLELLVVEDGGLSRWLSVWFCVAALCVQVGLHADGVRFHGWHPERREMLISAPRKGIRQLWVVSGPMGKPRQLTFSNRPVYEAMFEPISGKWVLFAAGEPKAGPQLFRVHADSEKPLPILLSDAKRPYSHALWAPNGQQVACLARSPGKEGLGLEIFNPLAPRTARRLESLPGGGWSLEHWAVNSGMMLMREETSDAESFLYLADAGTGTLSVLTPKGQAKVAHAHPRFSPGMDAVYFTSDRESEFQQLCRLDLRRGTSKVLTANLKWNVEAFAVAPSGAQAAVVVNAAGISQLHLLDLKGGKLKPVADVPRGVVCDLHWRGGGELGFSVSAADSAGDVFSLNVDSQKLTRWTRHNPKAHAAPSLGIIRAFDGEIVPLVYWMPDMKRFEGRRPVLVVLPDGPGTQVRPSHLGLLTPLLERHGIAVVSPNLRGASGYGSRHRDLDNGRLRAHQVRDLNVVLNWIRQQPGLNGERVALWGSRAGGSLALLAMAEFNAFIRCGVVKDAIPNWPEHIQNAPEWRRPALRVEFGTEWDAKTRAFLESISPLDAGGENLRAVSPTSPVLLAGASAPVIAKALRQAGKKAETVEAGELAGEAGKFLKQQLLED
ncbi:MAG: hypothetical protein CMO74_03610 [Verrucomicrobiales bacterium]|nr:hypothetical protein [Verrucomicrobiales bacterium]